MRCGLYGKLPSKRDFVALGAPREFLSLWEPWIQGGISASRNQLGNAWQEAFLHAPIWRFWLGADLCGATTAGAFMPSVDGVGRYFPLTVFARADAGEAIPPPELDPQDPWFEAAEDLLLSALAPETAFEGVQAAVAALAGPRQGTPGEGPPTFVLEDGTLGASIDPAALPEALAALRRLDHARAYATASFWWTVGGEGFAPFVLVHRKMPNPYVFTGMLTGRFAAAQAGQSETVR